VQGVFGMSGWHGVLTQFDVKSGRWLVRFDPEEGLTSNFGTLREWLKAEHLSVIDLSSRKALVARARWLSASSSRLRMICLLVLTGAQFLCCRTKLDRAVLLSSLALPSIRTLL
jgi:hypothetical protein